MAKGNKKKKHTYEDFLKFMEVAAEYQEELDKIFAKYKVNEKLDYIKQKDEYLADTEILEDYGRTLGYSIEYISNYVKDYKVLDRLTEKFGIEVHSEYYEYSIDGMELIDAYINGTRGKIYSLYREYYEEYSHEPSRDNLISIPATCDLYELYLFVEEMRKDADVEYEKAMKIKREKEEKEKAELESLASKYGDVDSYEFARYQELKRKYN